MAYQLFDHGRTIGVALSGGTRDDLFAAAAAAFTSSLTALEAVERRRPEEIDLAAPELDRLLVDFLSELLYRFDTRAWLTRDAEVDVRERDGGWALEGTLTGERFEPDRHRIQTFIKAVTYQELRVYERNGVWHARLLFEV